MAALYTQSPMTSLPYLTLSSVTKYFLRPDGSQRKILHDINLHVHGGDFLCIVGPSGSGKTTLLNLIAGIHVPDSGSITLNPEVHSRGYRLAYAFQQHRLLPWLTVEGNLRLALQATDINPVLFSSIVLEYLTLLGIERTTGAYPHQLSEGERLRVSLARSLCVKPTLLLLDEPLAHVDELTAIHLRELLRQIWEESPLPIIHVTHDPFEATYLASDIFMLSGTPATLSHCFSNRRELNEAYGDTSHTQRARNLLTLLRGATP